MMMKAETLEQVSVSYCHGRSNEASDSGTSDNLKRVERMVDSGSLVDMNKLIGLVQVAYDAMQIAQAKLCGKCSICREGMRQMLILMEGILNGEASVEALGALESLAEAVHKGSLCHAGKTSPAPILAVFQYFRGEITESEVEELCRDHQVNAPSPIQINPTKCKGCTMCARKCPVSAITGALKQPHHIDEIQCIKCGLCKVTCKFGAID